MEVALDLACQSKLNVKAKTILSPLIFIFPILYGQPLINSCATRRVKVCSGLLILYVGGGIEQTLCVPESSGHENHIRGIKMQLHFFHLMQ